MNEILGKLVVIGDDDITDIPQDSIGLVTGVIKSFTDYEITKSKRAGCRCLNEIGGGYHVVVPINVLIKLKSNKKIDIQYY